MNMDKIKKQIDDAFNRETGTQKLILCCSCFNMEKKARESFSVLFPNEINPELVKGRDRLFKLSQQMGNEHLKAIAKLTGRFAYYVELKDNKVVREYNLITGKRIA